MTSSTQTKTMEAVVEVKARGSPATTDAGCSSVRSSSLSDTLQHVEGFKLVVLAASVTLVLFLVMLDMSIIATAIPNITNQFHSLPDVGWYGSSYLLASCALQPLAGKLYAIYDNKLLYLSFLAVFELGSALCGAAQSSTMLIISRAVAGLGVAGLTNGSLMIIAAAAPMHKRPVLFGIIMAVSQLGIIGGPLIGGALTEFASWRWCFFINLPIGAVAAVFVFALRIPTDAHKLARKATGQKVRVAELDLPGFVFFSGFAVMLILALQWGGTVHPWRSATTIGLFCGSGSALIVFLLWEHRVGELAMIPLNLLRQRVIWASSFVTFFFFAALFTYSYYLPLYFQAVRNKSPLISGVNVLPGILSQLLTATLSGMLVVRWGYYMPWAMVSAIMASISAGLLSTLNAHTSTAKWVIYQMIGGLGRGLGMQMSIIAVQNHAPPKQIAVATALLMFAQTLGGALFLSFDDLVFEQALSSGLAKYAPRADAQRVISVGATGFRRFVDAADLPGVLEAYSEAIGRDFYLAAAASAAAFACCWGMGWKKIVKVKAASVSEV